MLTDTKIKSLKPRDKAYRIADHNGLCIEIRPTGTKLWRYRYRFENKASMLSLGEYPRVSLAEARKNRDDAKALLSEGKNPAIARREEKVVQSVKNANTFKVVAEEYIAEVLKNRSETYVGKVKWSLETDIFPVIGAKSVADVTAAEVLYIAKSTITRVRTTGARGTGEVTASNNIKIIGAVMRYAIATLRAENDPTYAVRGSINRPDVEHAQPLSKEQQVQFRKGVDNYHGTATVKNALLTLAYTMLRSIEIRRMKWEYIDFEERLITFPISTRSNSQERTMKKNRIHLVPMSDQLFNVLKSQYTETGNKEYVFSSAYSSATTIGSATLNSALKKIGLKNSTSHDFRATASTILNELDFDDDWIEKQLAHAEQNKVRASYNHAKYISQRRKMLQDWADIVDKWGQ